MVSSLTLQCCYLFLFVEHPRKRITQDGLQLGRHLKNRGRPVHTTWARYKAQMKGKREERHDGACTVMNLLILKIKKKNSKDIFSAVIISF